MADRCRCQLCRRHARVEYIIRKLRRDGGEPAAAFISATFDYLLDVEFELELHRSGPA